MKLALSFTLSASLTRLVPRCTFPRDRTWRHPCWWTPIWNTASFPEQVDPVAEAHVSHSKLLEEHCSPVFLLLLPLFTTTHFLKSHPPFVKLDFPRSLPALGQQARGLPKSLAKFLVQICKTSTCVPVDCAVCWTPVQELVECPLTE